MTQTIRVDIVSAEAEIFHGDATMVIATGEVGELGITPRHAPLITRLKPGHVDVLQENGERQQFYVSGGILEVQPQVVTVLADTAARASELDEADVGLAGRRVDRRRGDRPDPVLDRVSDMRHHLDRFAKVMTCPLALDHLLEDLPRRDAVAGGERQV